MITVWLPVESKVEDQNVAMNGEIYGILGDPRVTQYWDPDNISGRWLWNNLLAKDPELAHLEGGTVWDTFLLYGSGPDWTDLSKPMAKGYPVVRATDELSAGIQELLKRQEVGDSI